MTGKLDYHFYYNPGGRFKSLNSGSAGKGDIFDVFIAPSPRDIRDPVKSGRFSMRGEAPSTVKTRNYGIGVQPNFK